MATTASAAKRNDAEATPVLLPKADSAVAKAPPADAATGKPTEATGIVQLQESRSPDGVFMSYVDRLGGGIADTISVLIPLSGTEESAKTATERAAAPSKEAPDVLRTDSAVQATNTNAPLVSKDTLVKPVQPAAVVIPPAADAVKEKAPVKEEMTLVDSPLVKSLATEDIPAGRPNRANCARMATEKDLGAVRKKMVGIRDEDEMVGVALKDFKARCYTTEQVKALCFVFTREEGRYKLIDAAYPYVYDPAVYGQLESLLSDKYFIHRFKALIQ
jgi:hypothetical protein